MEALTNEPTPVSGFYRTRLVRQGPWVACRVWWEDGERDPETNELLSDQILRCTVAGTDVDPWEWWPRLCLYPIDKAAYDYMVADAEWARKYAPHHPKANPTKPVNAALMPPLF